MPKLIEEFRGFSGFDAPATNPFFRTPGGGRALESDVNDAGMSLDFGGVVGSNSGGTRGSPTVQVPTSPGRPSQPSRGLTGGNSNAGLVNRNLFRHDNTANTEWWVGGETNPNRPHEAIDFNPDVTVAASTEGNRVTDTGASGGLDADQFTYSQTPGETFDTAGLHNYGEPRVETPTSDARYVFDENAPGLFPDQNEWWRDGALAQGASTSNEGGTIWEGSEQISDFGGDLALGSDLNTSLDSLQFGEDYPATETAVAQTDTPFDPSDSLASGTGIPVESPALDQEYEWTTSPEDRRFLGDPPEEDARRTAGSINQGGTSISNFGGNMTLGNYLNMPLSMMNFGGGYPQISGGLADTTGRGHMNTGATMIDPSTGQTFNLDAIPTATGGSTYTPPGETWVDNAQGNPDGAPPPNDGTGTTTVQIPTANNSIPTGLTIIGHDTRNGQPIYRDAQGNTFVNPGTGTRISPGIAAAMTRGDYESPYGQSRQSQHASALMQMANATNLMNIRGNQTGESGRTMFYPGHWGRPAVNLEGGAIVRRPGGRSMGRGATAQVGGLG